MKYFLILFSAALMLCSCGKKELSLEETRELAKKVMRQFTSEIEVIDRLNETTNEMLSDGDFNKEEALALKLIAETNSSASEAGIDKLQKFKREIKRVPQKYRVLISIMLDATIQIAEANIEVVKGYDERYTEEEKQEIEEKFKSKISDATNQIRLASKKDKEILKELGL